MEAPPMGARSVKRPYHQQHPQDSGTSFMVSGMHALLFDDDTLAAFINSPAALLPWNGDQSLLIDRYDVRHLLQDLSSVRKRRPAPPLTDATEEELNYERFRDLHDFLSSAPQEESQNLEGRLVLTTCPFFYEQPPTEKLHQIIVGTAKFVKEHGGQSEVLLKVKQGSNPMFGFLNGDHHLHEYYRFLVQHPELLQPASQNIGKPAEPAQTTGEGLSLLGFAYGSGDDDDDRAIRPETNEADAGAGSLGNAVLGQGGLSSSDGCKANMDSGGGAAAPDKAVAVTSRSLTFGDDSRSKVTESVSKALPQSNKKKKTLGGTGERIQPNKRIVPQSKISDIPAKSAANSSNQLPRKSESKSSSWHSVPSIKDMNYGMSADAAAACVLAATRGARGWKQDYSINKFSSSSGLSQKVLVANGQPVDSNGGKGLSSLGLGQSDVRLAKAVAELAAIAASHEADSADALLTPAEKLKAERLRKAKMFAAMIKSGKCASESAQKPVEQPHGTSSAATSTKSDEMRTDGLCVIGKYIAANGKGVSLNSNINKSVCSGSADLASRQFVKERKYRSKEQNLDSRSDSEESEHQKKGKAHQEQKGEKKHRPSSKRRKHKGRNSESADSGLSSGDESTDERKSKSHRRHHHRRKRSHHERDEKDGKPEQSRHKSRDDDDGDFEDDLSHKKHKLRKRRDRSSSGSEDETSHGSRRAVHKDKQLRTASAEKERMPSLLANVKQDPVVDDRPRVVSTEVPADIREKVRAMLLSTL